VEIDVPGQVEAHLDRRGDLRDNPELGHRTPKPLVAELVIPSRKRLDNDGLKSARQSANFQITQWVMTISAAQTA
jgi:hypothetical protein